jgi:hypothetical protein
MHYNRNGYNCSTRSGAIGLNKSRPLAREWNDLSHREKRILETFDNQPDFYFNQLAEVMKPEMARQTVWNKVDDLSKDGYLIQQSLHGRKHFFRPSARIYEVHEYESDARKLIPELRHRIRSLKDRYLKMSMKERIREGNAICELILRRLRNLFIASFEFPLHRDHHLELIAEYRQLFAKIIDIVNEGPFAKTTRESIYKRLYEPHLTFDPRN